MCFAAPPAQSMVQALELLYALGGMPISHVFSYIIIGMLLVLFWWGGHQPALE